MATALLVIDVQPPFVAALPEVGLTWLPRVLLAVRAARLCRVPIFLTEQVPGKLGPTLPTVRDAAGPEATVWPKTAFSAWSAPGLPEALAAQGIEHLLIAGLETHVCVYQTALAAHAAGLTVTLLTDALASRRPADAEATLRFLLARTAVATLPVETVFYALLGDSTAPEFRAFTTLVKQTHQDETEVLKGEN